MANVIVKEIKVNNKKELKAVLAELDKEGLMWTGNIKITKFTPQIRVNYLHVWSNNAITHSTIDYKKLGFDEVEKYTAKEYIDKDKETNKKQCIVIYRKGTDTIALDKSTGKKAVAKLHPDDEYDFNVGAQLAFDRLTGREEKADTPQHVNCRCSLVIEVKRAAKKGEYIKITKKYGANGYQNGDIILVKTVNLPTNITIHSVVGINQRTNKETGKIVASEYVVLENYKPTEQPKEEFKPYLTWRGIRYGYIGESTPIKDVIGRELKIGDTVELYDERKNNRGERPICFKNGKHFVMGIACACKMDGTIEDCWKIIKKRSYEEIKDRECVDIIKYVKEV